VRELIPEFFYLPEMYLNLDCLDLGVQQNGKRVDQVILPDWAEGNPYKYVSVMRKSL
jgi:beige protein homolog 1